MATLGASAAGAAGVAGTGVAAGLAFGVGVVLRALVQTS